MVNLMGFVNFEGYVFVQFEHCVHCLSNLFVAWCFVYMCYLCVHYLSDHSCYNVHLKEDLLIPGK